MSCRILHRHGLIWFLRSYVSTRLCDSNYPEYGCISMGVFCTVLCLVQTISLLLHLLVYIYAQMPCNLYPVLIDSFEEYRYVPHHCTFSLRCYHMYHKMYWRDYTACTIWCGFCCACFPHLINIDLWYISKKSGPLWIITVNLLVYGVITFQTFPKKGWFFIWCTWCWTSWQFMSCLS